MSESYSVEAILKANVDNFVSGMKQARSQMDNFVKKNKETFDSFKTVGSIVTAAGTAIAGGLGLTVKLASDYQSAFAGVRKTTDATEAEFAKLSNGIREMAKRLPASAVEIANVAEVAGQLGIKKDDILKFSETMVNLGVATNMSSEEAATALARLANITQMPMQNIDRLGSTIVALGNNLATTESEITEMSLRLAGVGAQIGLSEADIAGLAASMSSVGIEAEAGGSAMSMVMKKIDKAVSLGSKAVSRFTDEVGLNANEFAALWKANPIEALELFIDALGESKDAGENVAAMLDFMGIKGIREQDAILRLVGAQGLLKESVDIANNAWDENTALTKEAEERYKTLESKMQMFMNVLKDIGISIGNVLMPYVAMLVDKLTELGKWVSDLNPKFVTIATVIAIAAAAVALLVGPFLLLIGFIPMIISGFAALSTVLATIGAVFSAIISPILLTIAAIGLIAGALVIAYNKVGWFRDSVNAIWQSIKEVAVAAFEVVKAAVLTAMDAVVGFVKEKLATLLAFWKENGAQISAAAQNIWNGILAVINFIMPAIQAVIKGAWFVIQVIVMSVWENIKGVIDGALNIIMGLVKTFASLFTGDWQGMWDGIKQLFSGAVEFLWNLVQLMLWGKLLKGVAVFAGSFKTAVTTMWSAIRGSFSNAVNAVKQLFTTGFNAMKTSGQNIMAGIQNIITTVWAAIKTVFSVTVNAVKTLFTNGFTAIRTTGQTIMNGLKNIISTVWNAIKAVFMNTINAVKNFVVSGFNLIRSTISSVMNGIRSLISSVWNSIKSTITSVVNSIKSAVSSGFSGVANAIRTKMAEAVKAVASKMVEMLGKVTSAAGKFLSAGKDLIRGLINGITQMGGKAITAITGVVDGVVNKAKSLLGIHSPSRVFKAIGEFTVEGLAVGIASSQSKANDAINGVLQAMNKTAKDNAKEVTKITTDAEKQRAAVQKEYAQKRAELSRKTALSSQSALKTHKNKKGQIITTGEEKVYRIRQEASLKLQKLNQEEQAKLSKIHDKTQVDIQKKEAELAKKRLDAVKLFIEDKKSMEQLSIVDEALIWQKAVDTFTAGTKEKVESQKAYAKALDEVNKEITTVNSKYASAMQKINDDFQKSEEDLTKKYQDSLQSRTDALKNFAGMFDEFDIKTDKSGAVLLDNLTNQVDGFKKWQSEIEKLAKRAIDDGLLAELKAMGPKALGELLALNSMSDEQLTKYSSLYREKSALARKQAEAELIGMKEDTEKQISALREAANKELAALQSDWQKELKSLSNNTSTELSSLKKIGVDAVKGLIAGIQSMHPDLQAVAKELADTVSETVKSALDIHSPSRVFMSIGSFITEGLSIGIMDSSQKAYSAVNKVTSKIVSEAREIITRGTSETNEHVKKLEKEFAADSIKIRENYNADIAHIRRVASIYERELTAGEKNQILELERNSAEAIERLRIQTGRTIASILEQDNANRLSQLKSFLADKKKEEEISALDEARIWDEAVKTFAAGTSAKIEAQKEYEKQLKIINDEIVKVNGEYANKIKAINDDLKKSEESLTQAYENEVGNRAKALNSFAGLFDAFNTNVEKSGDELLGNLKGQVDGFKTWQEQIELLAGKPIDIELLEELREMGPKALPELLALNSMTDQQLTEYSNLYKEKARLARLQAENELKGMKDDTAKRIDELRQTANAELDGLTKEWTDKIATLTQKTDEEFGSLNQVGVNAGKNLLEGLASMQGPLIAKATEIANAIKAAMQSALDIHSPSRWMRDMIGKNMMLGWIEGMQAMKSRVLAMAVESADWMKPDVGGLSVPDFEGVTVRSRSKMNSVSGATGARGDFHQIVNIHSPQPTSPSDNARLLKRQSQDMVAEWRG